MQREDADALRQRASGSCRHPRLEQEFEHRAPSGNLVCTAYGAVFTQDDFDELLAERTKAGAPHNDPTAMN